MSRPPSPLADKTLDVRGYEFMPVKGARLYASEFYTLAIRNPRGGLAAQKLWWVAWQQIPAGSLPANEYSLCTLADFGSDMRAWNRARAVAMHGFVLCDDGRYYHPVVVETAQKALAVREKARAKKAKQRANPPGGERHPDANRQEHDVNAGRDAHDQPSDFAETSPDCPPGRPGSVPAEGKVSNSGSLRSPAAVAAAGQALGSPEQLAAAAAGTASDGDLFGSPPPAPPPMPTPASMLFGEGMAKLIQMTGRSRDKLASWIGRMRKQSGDDDAMILALVQETHRRWVAQDAAVADPVGWISAGVKSRIAARTKPGPAEIPAEVRGFPVAAVVARCSDLTQADCDAGWSGFTPMIAEMLAAGADPEKHIFPVMKAAARKGVRTIDGVGWFRFAISGRLHGTEAA